MRGLSMLVIIELWSLIVFEGRFSLFILTLLHSLIVSPAFHSYLSFCFRKYCLFAEWVDLVGWSYEFPWRAYVYMEWLLAQPEVCFRSLQAWCLTVPEISGILVKMRNRKNSLTAKKIFLISGRNDRSLFYSPFSKKESYWYFVEIFIRFPGKWISFTSEN